MTRYKQRQDGEGWEVKSGQVFKLACCDCQLVHRVVIVEQDGELGIAAARDNRATGQRRRRMRKNSIKTVCKCTFSQHMVGDGCDICNPEKAQELKG